MKKIFCINCGSPILFELTVPKFCSSCGKPASSMAETVTATKRRSNRIMDDDETEENDDIDNVISRISEDDFTLDGVADATIQKFTIEQVANASKTSGSRGHGGYKAGDNLINDINEHCGKLKRQTVGGEED